MYVCLCVAVTENQVREAARAGCRSVRDLKQQLGCCARCGRCAAHAREVLAHARPSQISTAPRPNHPPSAPTA